MIRICFIALPSPFATEPAMDIPLGIGYIISYLKKKGFKDIEFVDFNLFKYDYMGGDWLNRIPHADVYGIQCTTPQFYYLVKVTKRIKKSNPNSLVISGGPHSTTRPKDCIFKAGVDITVVGDGEKTMEEILQGISKYKIKGICFKEGDDFFCTPPRDWVKDLDNLPFPDRSNYKNYKRTIFSERAFHIITSRGCAFNCAFCDKKSVGRQIRWRSIKNFLSEIDYCMTRYGIKAFVIYDDVFTLRKERAIKIAVELGKRGLTWRIWSRADTLDEEMLRVFKENGMSSITIGIESGDEKMLSVYNKKCSVETNRRALLLCKKMKIPVRASLIYGGPHETKGSIDNTIELIKETQPDEWNLSTFCPMPGSKIGDYPEQYGIKIYDDVYYLNYLRQSGETGMGEIMVDISTMTSREYVELRKYMVKRLEEVCPRRIIQDTIQELNV